MMLYHIINRVESTICINFICYRVLSGMKCLSLAMIPIDVLILEAICKISRIGRDVAQ